MEAINRRYTALAMVIAFSAVITPKANGQQQENVDCIDTAKAIGMVSQDPDYRADSCYVVYRETASGLSFKICNTTADTVYLFSTYLSDIYYSGKYLHRVDKTGKAYCVSFLPMVPYLSTKLSDKLIIGRNKLVNQGQLQYRFTAVPPGTFRNVNMSFADLFQDQPEGNCVRHFNVRSKGKFDSIKFVSLERKSLKAPYRLDFEFAIYKKVDLLCSQQAFFLDEFKFNQQALSFNPVSVQVHLKDFHLQPFD